MRKLENKELERKSIAAFKEAEKTPIIIILDDIRRRQKLKFSQGLLSS